MSRLIRTDPVPGVVRFDPFGDFDNLFQFPRLRRWLGELPTEAPAIKVDVTEDDKAYHVKAELPGVKKEDIAVEIDGNFVSLTAEVKSMTEEKKDEKVVHSERYYGRQYRSFTLPVEINRKAAEAKFADGVLDLTLPKGNGALAQRITVQ